MDVAEDIVMRNRLGLNNINLNEMDQSKEILNLKKCDPAAFWYPAGAPCA